MSHPRGAGGQYPSHLSSHLSLGSWHSRALCLARADALWLGLPPGSVIKFIKLIHPRIGFSILPQITYSLMAANIGVAVSLFALVDIKRCWELSRWGWAPLLARAWRLSGESRYLDGLNAWVRSWCCFNPVNGGTNWLCGQEVSMRLLHALQSWQLIDGPDQFPCHTPDRASFVFAHLQRIAATEHYAQAQDNNHWISEAAAMFIGGGWLIASASCYAQAGRQWVKTVDLL